MGPGAFGFAYSGSKNSRGRFVFDSNVRRFEEVKFSRAIVVPPNHPFGGARFGLLKVEFTRMDDRVMEELGCVHGIENSVDRMV